MQFIGKNKSDLTYKRYWIQTTFNEASAFFSDQYGKAPLLNGAFVRLADWSNEQASEASSNLCMGNHEEIIQNLNLARSTIAHLEPDGDILILIDDTIQLLSHMKKNHDEEVDRAYEMEGRE